MMGPKHKMSNIRKYLILAGMVLAASFGDFNSAMLFAASQAGQEKVATNVTADNMIYDSTAQKVTFSGKVTVTHPDYILTSDKLQLFLNNGQNGSSQRSGELNSGVVQKIIAESRVNIKLPEGRIASCTKATYNVDTETLTMEGKPVLREGQNQISADRMVFYLRENRNEAQGKVMVDFISNDAPSGFNEAGFGILGGDKDK